LADSTTINAGVVSEPRRSRRLRTAIRPWLTPKIVAGGTIVLVLIVVGTFAPWLAPYDPNGQSLSRVLRPPDWLSGPHVLGTDAVGRDILSRLFYGARISLVIAVMVVIISGVVGLVLGAVSGYFARTTDFVIQKLVEVVWAFPPLLLAVAIMAFLGQGLGNLILALVSQRWIA
jgi:peptide/nickel transport system permease protein